MNKGYTMEKATRKRLAEIAKECAKLPFHGYLAGEDANIEPIIQYFPKWNVKDADKCWCAAFVYYCCIKAGFEIPYSPDECISCSLAGCGGWEEFAIGDKRIEYYKSDSEFTPEAGDIVLYDRIFNNREHDHIGIILELKQNYIIVAEGNIADTNSSGVIKRMLDEHIRGYIRIPDSYKYTMN